MRTSTALAYVKGQWAGFLALFLVICGGTAYAANTVGTADIQNGAVTNPKLAAEAVTGAKISSETITGGKLAAGTVGYLSLAANAVKPGRCASRTLAVAGAQPGQVPVLAVEGQAHQGITFTAQRVPSPGKVSVAVCNLSGETMTAISKLPLRVMTLG